jgi:Pyruvate/2-oxoacid:ferredoxin oxidoreductase delta subunit
MRMAQEVYKKLCDVMAQRGGMYPGMDIPEFYAVAEELFTPEEAAVAVAMPRRPSSAGAIAQAMGREENEVEGILEAMADKGLCSSFVRDGVRHYAAVPFVPGIFEFQFMRGTSTERDRRLARLIHAYKEALDAKRGPHRTSFPTARVITVEKSIYPGSAVHTYDQVSSYIANADHIAVTTCFCRHEGRLLDEAKDCGRPLDVCMQFGPGAQYVIERGMGREVTKEEALEVLKRAEEAGLVHTSNNVQEGIDFLCNCCPCHCMILKEALTHSEPSRFLSSGFRPSIDRERCVGCETCVQRCPAGALSMNGDVPQVDTRRCFGCGVCATGCPSEAIEMVKRPEAAEPPINRKALAEALFGRR